MEDGYTQRETKENFVMNGFQIASVSRGGTPEILFRLALARSV